MSPIPGEPLKPRSDELETSDGRKVKLTIPGLGPKLKPQATEERGAAEPPRDDPRLPVDPHVGGF
jgi:hypothetical protein